MDRQQHKPDREMHRPDRQIDRQIGRQIAGLDQTDEIAQIDGQFDR